MGSTSLHLQALQDAGLPSRAISTVYDTKLPARCCWQLQLCSHWTLYQMSSTPSPLDLQHSPWPKRSRLRSGPTRASLDAAVPATGMQLETPAAARPAAARAVLTGPSEASWIGKEQQNVSLLSFRATVDTLL
jgi:hypothetical protein